MIAFVRSLDPKLVTTVLSFAATRTALALGVSLDPALEAAIAGIVAALVGYWTANEATVLRTPQEDGNPVMPLSEHVPPGGEDIV